MKKLVAIILTLISFNSISKVNKISIVGTVDGYQFHNLIYKVEKSKLKNHEIEIYSGGGMIMSGLYMMDYIHEKRKEGHKFTCKVRSAASMAMTILNACNKVLGYKDSSYMQHRASPPSWLSDQLDIIRFRLLKKRLKIKFKKFYKEYILPEKVFNEKEALRLGIIDAII